MPESLDPLLPQPLNAGRCPICGKKRAAAYRPFCSARCAQIDLGRWLKDSYRVESDEPPEDPSDDSG